MVSGGGGRLGSVGGRVGSDGRRLCSDVGGCGFRFGWGSLDGGGFRWGLSSGGVGYVFSDGVVCGFTWWGAGVFR